MLNVENETLNNTSHLFPLILTSVESSLNMSMIFNCQRKFAADKVKQTRKSFPRLLNLGKEFEFNLHETKDNEGRGRGIFSKWKSIEGLGVGEVDT